MHAERWTRRSLLGAGAALALGGIGRLGQAAEMPEYQLKAAFLYNFAAFTEWPDEVGQVLTVCVVGVDPFGAEADGLKGRTVGKRQLSVRRPVSVDALANCRVVFVPAAASALLARVCDVLSGQPALIVAETQGALDKGAMLNMIVRDQRVTFEANLVAARAANLGLSARLLRLATTVLQ